MSQQVNLLAPIFRKQRALLSARFALLVCAAVAGVAVLLQLVLAWQVGSLSREQAQLVARRDAATQQLAQLAEQMRGGGRSQALVAERDALRAQVEEKRRSLAALSRSELGNTTGFSPQLIGLARQRLSGLWLTGVKLNGGGRQLELAGMTLDEALVPRYLGLLGNEPVFRGTRFNFAQLNRDATADDGRAPLRFELRSLDSSLAAAAATPTPAEAAPPAAAAPPAPAPGGPS